VQLAITSPGEGESVRGVLPIFGSASLPGFASYELQYGISHDPGAFSPPFSGPVGAPVISGQLGTWDTTGLGNGPHTLRLLLRASNGAQYETRVRVFVDNTRPTDMPAPTPTWTPEAPTLEPPTVLPPTETPWPTDTPLPPDTPVLPTDTPLPPEEPPVDAPPVEAPPAEPTFDATPTWTPEVVSE
jgi:hypothetical protein